MENNNFGQVKISNDVVATIAGLAALEVEGVETNTTFTDKILKNNGVKIQIEEEEVSLDVMVMIDYGVSIPEIALKIQENYSISDNLTLFNNIKIKNNIVKNYTINSTLYNFYANDNISNASQIMSNCNKSLVKRSNY